MSRIPKEEYIKELELFESYKDHDTEYKRVPDGLIVFKTAHGRETNVVNGKYKTDISTSITSILVPIDESFFKN
jgi:hypothetical protein